MTDPIYCYYHRHARMEITQRYGETYAVCPECRRIMTKGLRSELIRTKHGNYHASDDLIHKLINSAEQWASPRREELFPCGRKSAITALTTYGYRLGNPTLKPAQGWTWDKVVALLKATRRKAYLVTKVTPDKEAIRLHVKPHKLAKLGMQIKQEEMFFVERATKKGNN